LRTCRMIVIVFAVMVVGASGCLPAAARQSGQQPAAGGSDAKPAPSATDTSAAPVNPYYGNQQAPAAPATSAPAAAEEKKTVPSPPEKSVVAPPAADNKTADTAPSPDKAVVPSAPGIDPNSTEYTIGDGDVLAINVWREPEISRSLPVRADGKISLPLINGEIQAAGKTPAQLQAEIVQNLRAVIENPEVTVIVQDARSRVFIVLGKVNKEGTFPINRPMTMLDAIADAGGFKDFANKKKITLMRDRPDGTVEVIHFNYPDAIKKPTPANNPPIQAGDKINVP
jgi:polysaccharide biosynthesis/export protein